MVRKDTGSVPNPVRIRDSGQTLVFENSPIGFNIGKWVVTEQGENSGGSPLKTTTAAEKITYPATLKQQSRPRARQRGILVGIGKCLRRLLK